MKFSIRKALIEFFETEEYNYLEHNSHGLYFRVTNHPILYWFPPKKLTPRSVMLDCSPEDLRSGEPKHAIVLRKDNCRIDVIDLYDPESLDKLKKLLDEHLYHE